MLTPQDLSEIKLTVTDIVVESENRIKTELRSELASKEDISILKTDVRTL